MKKITMFVMIALLCFFTGCPKETDLELTGTIHIEPQGTIKLEDNIVLTAVYSGKESVSYQWNRNNAAMGSKTTNNKFIPTRAGAYTVTASSAGYKSLKSESVTVYGVSMSFVDDLKNPGREFLIDQDLLFRVELFAPFFAEYDEEDMKGFEEIGFVPGLVVTGNVTETDNIWTDPVIEGIARNMRATNPIVNGIFTSGGGFEMGIRLTYLKEKPGEPDEITAINVEFTSGDQMLVDISGQLMGGIYVRKQ